MINKNSSGQPLSANYDSTVSESSRDWDMMLYLDGAPLDCSIKNVTIKKGSCGSTESFSIGNVYSSMMTAELLNLSTDIKNEDLEVRIGLNTDSIEWITLGWFTAIDVVKSVESTSVTAYGFSTSKTGGSFVIPQTLSLGNIASAIQTATGKTVTFGAGINTSYVLAGSIDEGTNCYIGLQILAHAVGGYAIDTNGGGFLIDKFSDTATLSVSTEQMKYLPQVEELPFDITGVQVIAIGQYRYFKTTDVAIDPDKTYYTYNSSTGEYVEVEEPDVSQISNYYEREDLVYSYGTPVVLSDENPNMSTDVFNIYKAIVGYSFYTSTIELTLGDPRIEGNDVLSVDIDGVDYAVPCHNVEHRYDGGLSTTVEAVKSSSEGTDLISNAPISQQIDTIGRASAIAKASAESAKKSAESAQTSAQSAVEQATIAYNKAVEVNTLAQQAKADAQSAQTSAGIAYRSAMDSLVQLGMVEDVLGTLEWISNHAIYVACTETEVIEGKAYFTLTGTAIANPTGNPSEQAYYELISGKYVLSTDTQVDSQKTYYQVTASQVASPSGDPSTIPYYEMEIDEAVVQYINTHLALTDRGLSVTDGSQSSMLISSDGVTIYGSTGQIVGQYGEGAIIGNTLGYHIEITTSDETQQGRLSFKNVNTEIAYMTNDELYIPRVVVVDSMQIGNWIWDAISSENHLTLKWRG